MARSIAWPLKRTVRGGLALTAEDDHGRESLRQVIVLGVSPSRSANPFDTEAEVGGVDMVFAGDNGSLAGRCVQSVQKLFRRLESQGRARLESGYPKPEKKSGGETTMKIMYTDLEASQPGQVEVK
jgi:hypothetical protein